MSGETLTCSRKPFVVACIPAYNEERTIAAVVLKAQRYVDRVIVCDDGSSDLTGEIAKRMGAEVVVHENNKGKGAAIKSLLRRALALNADIIVTLDADLQHDPEEIFKLITPILKGEAEVTLGSRFVPGAVSNISVLRLLGARLINWVVRKSLHVPVKDIQTGFRAYSRRAAEIALKAEANNYGVEQEQLALLTRAGLKIVEVPVTVRYGGLKTSKKHPLAHGGQLLTNLLKLVIEERPLLTIGLPGILTLLIGTASLSLLIWHFNKTRYFSLPLALITIGTVTTGLLLLTTALTFYALNRLAEKMKRCK